MTNRTSEKSFTPKYELGSKVYIVDERNREVFEGNVLIARLEKSTGKNEYGNFCFDLPFSLKEHYDIRYWEGAVKIVSRYEDEVFPTIEDAMNYLSKLILKKFRENEIAESLKKLATL